jgi:hypothetical protein
MKSMHLTTPSSCNSLLNITHLVQWHVRDINIKRGRLLYLFQHEEPFSPTELNNVLLSVQENCVTSK